MDNGTDEREDVAVTTATSAPRTTTDRDQKDTDDDGETNTERIWPRITETTTEAAATATTSGESSTANNVTEYHFHGDYETVAAHKVN